MLKRTFVLVGTIVSSLVVLLGLFWFFSSSAPVARADSVGVAPAVIADTARHAAYSGPCITITHDITANTTWTQPCYLVAARVAVTRNATLTISPGTLVQFQSESGLHVHGHLHAVGASGQLITFTSALPNPNRCSWDGLTIDKDSGGDRVEYALIEYACTGVNIENEKWVKLRHNTFRHNGGPVSDNGAIGGITDYSIIAYNTIYDCENGIYLRKSSDNSIFSNVISDSTNYGVAFVEAPQVLGGSYNGITSNVIYHSGSDGLRLENGDGNSVFSNTIYYNGGHGIYLSGVSGWPQWFIWWRQTGTRVRHNHVFSNGLTSGDAAIYIDYTRNMSDVITNVVHAQNSDAIFYGANNYDNPPLVMYNALCSDPSNTLPTLELRNNDVATITATHNWWGTNTPLPFVNYAGPVVITPHITLTLIGPAGMRPDAGGLDSRVVTVTLRDVSGATVPTPTNLLSSPPAPNARRIELQTDWGSWSAISPPAVVTYVVVSDAGLATATLYSEHRTGLATITATAFCEYPVIHQFTITPTNLAITKTVAVTQVVAGNILTYSISYTNTSTVQATNVYITDTLPPLTSWFSDSSDWPSRTVTTAHVVWFTPTLAPGANSSFVLTVTVAPTACGRLLTNTVTITSLTAESTYADNTASAGPVKVICADLVVFKDDNVGPTSPLRAFLHKLLGRSQHREFVYPGDLITYTIDVHNAGEHTAFDVMLTETMPVTYADYVPLPSYMGTGVLTDWVEVHPNWVYTLDVGTLLPGEGRLSYFVIRIHDDLPYTVTNLNNLICGTTTSPDADPDDNCNREDTPVRHPRLGITKTANTTLSKAGHVITYNFDLHNIGDVAFTCAVTDSLLGPISPTVPLPLGAHWIHALTRTVLITDSDPLVNIVTATCQVVGGPPKLLVVTDTWSVDLVHPSVVITKTGDTTLSKAGDVVTYTLAVTNTGDVTLTCALTDSLIPIPSPVITLPPGVDWSHIAARTVLTGDSDPLRNTFTATCRLDTQPRLPNILTVTATHEVDLVHPCLAITKTGDLLSKEGDDVVYAITVCNCGDVTLIKQDVSDSLIGGVNDVFSDTLPPGRCETHTFTRTVRDGDPNPLVNAVSAFYKVEGLPNTLHELAHHSVDLVHPGLVVTKTGSLLSKAGDVATYVITVCNTGDVTLLKRNISDTLIPDAGNVFTDALPAGDCESHPFTRTVLITDPHPLLTNTVTISYQVDGLHNVITDTDSHTVILVRPQVAITKTANTTLSKAGHVITYIVAVTNTGDVTLTCGITDSLIGSLTSTVVLSPGAPWSRTLTRTVLITDPDPLVNTATVACTIDKLPNLPKLDNIITDTVTHTVDLVHPDLDIAKTSNTTLSKADDVVTYTVTLTNTGDVTLTCALTDSLIVSIPPTVTLPPSTTWSLVRARTVLTSDLDPLRNTFTATCELVTQPRLDNIIVVSDTHWVDLLHPGLWVIKTGDPRSKLGDVVTYVITICNTGDVTLTKLSITDTLIPGVDLVFSATLPPSPTCESHAFTHTVTITDHDPLVNEVTARYQPEGLPNVYEDSARHEVDLVHPCFTVDKTGDALSKVGDTVTYCIKVCNTGDVALIKKVVTDTLIPGVDNAFSGTLPFGKCEPHIFTRTVLSTDPDFLWNEVTAVYQVDGLSNVLTDTSAHTVNLFQPSVQVDKTGPTSANVGDTITYTFRITNTGSADSPPLILDSVVDVGDGWPGLGGLTGVANANNCDPLAAGDSCTFTMPYTITAPGTLTNTVTITYHSDGFTNVITDSDDHVVHPLAVSVAKNGNLLSKVGDIITYTFCITNISSPGSPDLILDSVVDVGDGWPGLDDLTGVASATNCITLTSGASCSFTVPYTVQVGVPHPLLTNTVTITYYAIGFSRPITATDSHTVTLVHPGLAITKTGDLLSKAGDDVTYVITICNTGDVTLTKLSVTDTLIPGVNPAFSATLPPSPTCETHTFTRTVLITDPHPWLTNTVTATYRVNGLDNIITATDIHAVRLVSPSLALTKTASTPVSKEGDLVTYTIEIHNTGDVTLTCTVTDTLVLLPSGFPPDPLPPGEYVSHTYPYTVPAGYPDPLVNTTTATCQVHGLPNIFTVAKTVSVDLVHPGLTITKTGDLFARVGDDVTYVITICNTGDVTLTKLSVVDSLIPVNGDYALSLPPTTCETRTFTRTVLPTDLNILSNTVTATYQVAGLPNTLTVTSTHVVTIARLAVSKTGPARAEVGDVVTYTIAITNTGGVALTKVSVTDTLIPPLTPDVSATFGFSLPPGGHDSQDFTRTVLSTDPTLLKNTVIATYQVQGLSPSLQVVATDNHTVVIESLVITKTGDALSKAGDDVTYVITVCNTGNVTLTRVSVTDTLIPPLVPNVSATLSYTLPPGFCDSQVFTRTVLPTDPDPLVNIVTAIYRMEGAPHIKFTATDDHAVDLVHPCLTVNKTGDLFSKAGDDVTYTIQICNTGDVTLTKEAITDTLIPSVNTVFTDVLPPGHCESYQFTRTVLITDPDPLLNAVTARYRVDGLSNRVQSSAYHSVDLVHPDVTITKTGDTYAQVSDTVDYTITVINTGDVTLLCVVTDTLIPIPGNPFTILLPSEHWTLNLTRTVLATDPVPLVNTATVTCYVQGLPNIITATDNHTVSPMTADLGITKTDYPDPVFAGDRLTYTLSVHNYGPADATGVVVTDTLPAQVDFITATFGGSVCPESGGVVTCDLGDLPVGDTVTVTILVTPTVCPITITNTATVTSTTPDPDLGNNLVTETTTVTCLQEADLGITKSDDPGTVCAGDRLTYTLVVTNHGPDDASGVVVTDTLPNEVDFITATFGGGVCPESGGIVTCDLGDLPVGDTVTVTILVTPTVCPITITNTATVTSTTPDPDLGNNLITETTTVTCLQEADLGITKSDDPGTVCAGDWLTYTLVVTNHGPDDASGVVVTDTLPNEVDFITATFGGGVCPESGGIVTCDLGDLPVGDTVTVTILVTSPTGCPQTITNTADVAGDQLDLGPHPNHATEDTEVICCEADLGIVKSDDPGTVCPNSPLTYTLTVHNHGPADATGVRVTDTLPAGVTFVGVFSSQGTCQQSGGVVTCDLGNLPVTHPVTITIVVTSPIGCPQTITNTAHVAGDQLDLGPHPNHATEDTGVICCEAADLGIAKTDCPDPVCAGDRLTYTLVVTNHGPDGASGVVVTDTLPNEVDFITATFGGGVCPESGGIVTCDLGDLPVGDTVTVTILVTPTVCPITITNTATVTSTTPDPDLGNNLVTETTTVTCLQEADLGITKSDDPGTVCAGDWLTYTLVVTNHGPDDASGVVVTDTLPNEVDFITATFGGGVCPESGGIVTCDLGDLPVGDTVTVTILVTPTVCPITITNTATVTSTTPDPDLGNNLVTETTTVTCLQEADLAITKTDDPNLVCADSPLTYTLTVHNYGPADASDVVVTDTLPGAVTFVDATPSQGTCQETGGVVTCDLGDLSNGDTATIVVRVTPTVCGLTITNTADVMGNEPEPVPDPHSNHVEEDTQIVCCEIKITKTGPDCAYEGDTITYTFYTTNTSTPGSPDLILVSITDTLLGDLTPIARANGCDPLTLTHSCHFAVTYIVQPGDLDNMLTNTVMATYHPDITATDSHVVRRCPKLYVANEGAPGDPGAPGQPGTIEVFKVYDIDHISHTKTITDVGEDPSGMATCGDCLFVVDFNQDGEAGLYAINTISDTVVYSVPLPPGPPGAPGQEEKSRHPVRLAVLTSTGVVSIYVTSHSNSPAFSVYTTSIEDGCKLTLAITRNLNYALTSDYGFFGATADTERDMAYFAKRNFGGRGIWSASPPTNMPEYVCSTEPEGKGDDWPYLDKARPFSILYHRDKVYVTFALIDELWVFDPSKWPASNPNACITETRVMTIATGHQDPTPDSGHGGQGLAALGRCVFVSNYLSKSVTAVCPVNYRVYLPIIIKNWASGSTGGGFTSESISHNLASAPIKVTTIRGLNGRPTGMTAGLGHYLFVTLPLEDKVAIIDTETLTVTGYITVTGDHPHTVILAGGN